MLQDIYYSRKTNKAVQVISECQIMPDGKQAVCYQEMTGNFSVYVMEKTTFYQLFCKRSNFVKDKAGTLNGDGKTNSFAEGMTNDVETSGLLKFLDADTYHEKIKILEGMKDELDNHILNNMAVSLDLSIEDGMDGYSFIMSELRIRSRFEGKRGERL